MHARRSAAKWQGDGRASSHGRAWGQASLWAACLRTGAAMTGPLPRTTSNSMPSAGSGVRMSLNMITPSGRNARQGCSDSSIAISAVSERSRNPSLSEYLSRGRAAKVSKSS